MQQEHLIVDRAERIGRIRSRFMPAAGILLIVLNAIALDSGDGLAGRAGWLALFAGCFVLVVSGGVLSKRLRALTDDESARAHRLSAVFVGYCATVACAAGLYIVSAFVVLSAREAIQIVLATALAAPMIGFGVRERQALE